jgi:Uma2 family endonuclease
LYIDELEIDIEGGGSTLFLRQDLARGFEPDECFYIQHAELERRKKQHQETKAHSVANLSSRAGVR